MKKKKPKDKIRHRNKIRKKQLEAAQKYERIPSESLDKITRRLTELTGVEHKFVRNESDVSMSDALLEYAEPFMDVVYTDNKKEYERAIMMAVCLWNAAIMREEGNEQGANRLLEPLMEDAESKGVVHYMLNRKREMFPDISRYILDYEVTERGDDFHLSVASTPQK